MNRPIAIVKFGSSALKIAERIKATGVPYKVVEPDLGIKEVRKLSLKGVILSGSSGTSWETSDFLKADVPILGICYGMQLIAHSFGGKIERCATSAHEHKDCYINPKTPLFSGMGTNKINVNWDHNYCVKRSPLDFEITSRSEHAPISGFQNLDLQIFGVQFHPESTKTNETDQIFHNFVYNICKCDKPNQ